MTSYSKETLQIIAKYAGDPITRNLATMLLAANVHPLAYSAKRAWAEMPRPHWLTLAKSDTAMVLMVAAPSDLITHRFWVEVIKDRRKANTSRHAFATLKDALDYMEAYVK